MRARCVVRVFDFEEDTLAMSPASEDRRGALGAPKKLTRMRVSVYAIGSHAGTTSLLARHRTLSCPLHAISCPPRWDVGGDDPVRTRSLGARCRRSPILSRHRDPHGGG